MKRYLMFTVAFSTILISGCGGPDPVPGPEPGALGPVTQQNGDCVPGQLTVSLKGSNETSETTEVVADVGDTLIISGGAFTPAGCTITSDADTYELLFGVGSRTGGAVPALLLDSVENISYDKQTGAFSIEYVIPPDRFGGTAGVDWQGTGLECLGVQNSDCVRVHALFDVKQPDNVTE